MCVGSAYSTNHTRLIPSKRPSDNACGTEKAVSCQVIPFAYGS